jgi:FlaA1/EpsC-like NDP-sugar epimerase
VTGAAGSIGSELCRQLATYACQKIVLYERNENGLFGLEQEFRRRFPGVTIYPVLGDILAADQVARTFDRYRPHLVLHAAACKHVSISELNVVEAARNNVLGTRTLVHAACDHGVREFVMVSTDKAVQPASVMGATKRVAEMVVRAQQDHGCKFVSVRFGNVLGSTGSVVPIFAEQIARGGPVTITHPEVQRFFMTIPEAAQLILQAGTMGRGGEIFVLEMGEPVRIVDLARNMIKLSGFQPDEDIQIVYTGLRPGEKLSEELFNLDEEIEATFFDRIKILRSAASTQVPIDALLGTLEMSIAVGDATGVIAVLQTLAPDYTPSEHVLPSMRSPVAAMGS